MADLLDPLWIGSVSVDGQPTLKLTCPGCGTVGYLDDDQAHGRVSVHCECGWHETHDFWAIKLAAPSPKEEP